MKTKQPTVSAEEKATAMNAAAGEKAAAKNVAAKKKASAVSAAAKGTLKRRLLVKTRQPL